MPRMPERTCRKRPVPAAHLSFIRKSCTEPSGAVLMTLLSCPPMSSTTPVPGKRWTAPRAWQVISVTTLSAKGREMRPYPVPTIRDAAIPPASAQAAASAFSPASRAFQPVGRTALPNSERDWGSKITALAATEPTSTPATGIRFSLWGRRRMRNPWGSPPFRPERAEALHGRAHVHMLLGTQESGSGRTLRGRGIRKRRGAYRFRQARSFPDRRKA